MKYVYRIVNIVLAALAFPVVIFMNLIEFRLGSQFIDTVGLQEGISIKFLIDVYRGVGQGTFWNQLLMNNEESGQFNFEWPVALDPVKGKIIGVVVSLAIVLVAILFIIVWSCISNKRIPVLAAALTGIGGIISMYACFESAIKPILDGTISISSIIGGSGLISLITQFGVVQLDDIRLGDFYLILIFLFIGLLGWTGAYYLIEIGDSPEEKALAQAKRKKR